jgi:hypothetical protein
MRKLLHLAAFSILLLACVLVPASPTPTGLTPPPAGPCNLSATNSVNIYTFPSAAADLFGTFGTGDTAEATARTADGFYGFEPGVAQAGNVGIFRLRWILKTHDVTLSPGCAGIPTVVGPITGICYAMIDHDTPIYSNADATSAVVATLHLGDYEMVLAQNPGWFTLDLNVGSPSMDSIGYLQMDALGGFKGPCEGV